MNTEDAKGNRIGLRRLFEAPGCSLSNREEVAVDLIVSEHFHVRIYLGLRPEHGIQIVSGAPKYLIPGSPMALSEFTIASDATTTQHSGKFYLEIAVSRPAESTNPDIEPGKVREELLRQAQSSAPEFSNIIDLIAGIIGLRFHRQFILEPLDENTFAWEGETPSRNFTGPIYEILQDLKLTDYGIARLEAYRGVLQNLAEEPRRKLGLVFHWLLRAWRERDPVYRFVAFFLPLEAVLSIVKIARDSEQKEQIECIRRLIRAQKREDGADLISLINKGFERLSPTLDDKFAALAEAAQLPGWQGDVEAFRRFKRFRNALVHRGDISVQHRLTVGADEVRTLEDLVERYVNHVIFRDDQVYQSRWRPQMNQDPEEDPGTPE